MQVKFYPRETIQSFLVMFYFVFLIIHNIYRSPIVNYLWQGTIVLCFLAGFARKKSMISKEIVCFVLVIIASAIMNYVFIGNSSYGEIVFVIFYLGIYRLLADEDIDERYILVAIVLDCLLVSMKLISAGLGRSILTDTSNNFISVMLLMPVVVYYLRVEHFNKRILLTPAVLFALTCVLAVGRGGIISGVLLLAMVFAIKYFSDKKEPLRNRSRYLMMFAVGVFCLGAVALLIVKGTVLLNLVLGRFMEKGMYGTGRSRIWGEYFSVMLESIKNILFGVNFSKLALMIRYKNNLHNSFLNMHAYYGLLPVMYIIIRGLRNIQLSLHTKHWLYAAMVTVFFLRAFTDKIFGGGSVATPILFFVIWYINAGMDNDKIYRMKETGIKDNE